MVGMKFSILELCLDVSVEVVNKRAKFSFEIVGMSLLNNVTYMFYSAILKKQLKKVYLSNTRKNIFLWVVKLFTAKENLPMFEILRVEWTQQFQQGETDLYKHFLLQPSESSFESIQWNNNNLPLYLNEFYLWY